MIGYVTVGTNNLQRAGAFYDALLKELGAERGMVSEKYIGWANAPDAPMFMAITPYDGKPATVGNGMMISLLAKSKEQVDRVYKKALALGGKDEGAAGPRGDNFYGGYFRDLDGNKLCVFIMS
jgi:catechol 2,3-dioxygenase-like lactoylglutathione lyase family enzyme